MFFYKERRYYCCEYTNTYSCSKKIVWNGNNYLVVWNDVRDTSLNTDICAQLVGSLGNLIDTNFALISRPYRKYLWDICAGDSNYFVIFTEYHGNATTVMSAIISFQGLSLGTVKIYIIFQTHFILKTEIQYTIKTADRVKLNIYDLTGKLVKEDNWWWKLQV